MKRKIMRILDITMFILLFVLMSFQITGQQIHEVIGIITFACFTLHHIFNWRWYKSVFKGKYTLFRLVFTFINMILLLDIILLFISGLMMSQYVFSMFSGLGSLSLARRIHMCASYWGFILMSIHMGMHWHIMLLPIKKKIKSNSRYLHLSIFRLLPIVFSVLGIIALIENQFISYMFLMTDYVFFDYGKSAFQFITEYLMISSLFITITYVVFKLIKKRKNM